MAVTRMGLGGPLASFASGGGPEPPPAPSGGGNLLLLNIGSLLLAILLPFLA
jgi:hypothetical protein